VLFPFYPPCTPQSPMPPYKQTEQILFIIVAKHEPVTIRDLEGAHSALRNPLGSV
jgi:hypothetical protein